MSDFRRRGFTRAAHGILQAARIWHGEDSRVIEDTASVAVSGHGPLPAASCVVFEEYKGLISAIAERLIGFLRNGELGSFHFNRQFGGVFDAAPAAFWSKPEAVDMLIQLFFEARETQSSASQPVPRDSLYFRVSDLAELLDAGNARRRTFFGKPLDTEAKKRLADVLQSLSEQRIPRPEQFPIVRESSEFLEYRITDRDFRKAAKRAPLPPGRPRVVAAETAP
jgi:hypothetical protein